MDFFFLSSQKVEEIDYVDGSTSDPFVADAVAKEHEMDLSEAQKNNFKKVKEEDDAIIDRKLQVQLKRRRLRNRSKQLEPYSPIFEEQTDLLSNGDQALKNDMDEEIDIDLIKETENGDTLLVSEVVGSDIAEIRGAKRLHQNMELDTDNKKALKSDKFLCTACDEVADEVHTHPLLKVIVCQDCKCIVEEKMQAKDQNCMEGYCGWCGGNKELISCKSCDKSFCTSCVKRNLGEECISKFKLSGWRCCCDPSILQHLTLQLEKALISPDTDSSSDNDSDSSDGDGVVSISSKRKRKKKIRRILDDVELGEETKRRIAIEKERQERLKSLRAQFSNKSKLMSSGNSSWNISEGGSIEVLGDALTSYIVNVVREKGEEAVRIPQSISSKLKAHQDMGRMAKENSLYRRRLISHVVSYSRPQSIGMKA